MNIGIAFIIPFLLRGILLSMYAMNYCNIPKRSMRTTIKYKEHDKRLWEVKNLENIFK